MREIKFRAWHIPTKTMHSVRKIDFESGQVRAGVFIGNFDWKDGSDAFVLMQSTGLIDKNEKEVFEGDLVQHPDFPTVLRVEWDHDQWGLFDNICNEASLSEDCEIKGNIYEGHK